MNLPRQGREPYLLSIATDPNVTSWEATFDGGLTWVLGQPDGEGVFRWLLAGPFAPTDAVTPDAVIARPVVTPQIRATEGEQIIIRPAPPVRLV